MADRAAPPVLVLGSVSPRRVGLLGRLGLTPVIRPADLDETPQPGEGAEDLVARLALQKAAAVAAIGTAHGRDEVVLAADTEIVLDGRPLGKPRDADDATGMLMALSGRSHDVMTGLAVRRGSTVRHTVVTTRVTFRALGRDEVAWYVATEEPMGKAGGYGLQGAGAVLVDHIHGSDTNVVGLPLAATVALLREVGFDVMHPPG